MKLAGHAEKQQHKQTENRKAPYGFLFDCQ